MAASTVRVHGLRELQRDLSRANKDIAKDLRGELKTLAEPVRALAESKADSSISHIGSRWGRMRVGVTSRSVYVAPRSKRQGGSPRPNLAALLMDRAMQPALDDLSAETVSGVELMLDRFGVTHGF